MPANRIFQAIIITKLAYVCIGIFTFRVEFLKVDLLMLVLTG
jgi:hypothetical protein